MESRQIPVAPPRGHAFASAIVALAISAATMSSTRIAADELLVSFVDWRVELESFDIIDDRGRAIGTGTWTMEQTGSGFFIFDTSLLEARVAIEVALVFPGLSLQNGIATTLQLSGPFVFVNDGLTGWIGFSVPLSGSIVLEVQSALLDGIRIDVNLHHFMSGSVATEDETPPAPPAEQPLPDIKRGRFVLARDETPSIFEFSPFFQVAATLRARPMNDPLGSVVLGTGGAAMHPRFVRGDANNDGALEMADAVLTLDVLFRGRGRLFCEKAADADDDGHLRVTDAIATLQRLFLGGDPLPHPSPGCGVDWTADELDCSSLTTCQSPGE
jgi:hypothetical protein